MFDVTSTLSRILLARYCTLSYQFIYQSLFILLLHGFLPLFFLCDHLPSHFMYVILPVHLLEPLYSSSSWFSPSVLPLRSPSLTLHVRYLTSSSIRASLFFFFMVFSLCSSSAITFRLTSSSCCSCSISNCKYSSSLLCKIKRLYYILLKWFLNREVEDIIK